MRLFYIADDEEEANDGPTVVNLVDAHGLNEMQLSKKDLMAMIKAYLKRVAGHLKEQGNEDRVAGFKAGATEMVKFVVGKFDEMQVFSGKSMDTEAGLCFAYTKDEETDPTFLFFLDGMREEKF